MAKGKKVAEASSPQARESEVNFKEPVQQKELQVQVTKKMGRKKKSNAKEVMAAPTEEVEVQDKGGVEVGGEVAQEGTSSGPSKALHSDAVLEPSSRQEASKDSSESNESDRRNPKMKKGPLSLKCDEVVAPQEPKITLSISEIVKLVREEVAKEKQTWMSHEETRELFQKSQLLRSGVMWS